MTLFEIILTGGLFVLLATVILLMRQVAALRSVSDDRSAEQMLLQLQARVQDMAEQSERLAQSSRQELGEQLRANREETGKAISQLSETVRKLGAEQAEGQAKFGDRVDAKMKELRQENSAKLDEMRKTVDEKLQTTLERRLSESFKNVSERLEAVQRGLGEMQSLATGVGDLKRVLTNVKSRGTFGEVQLGLLIEDFLTPDQYQVNYDCGKSHGNERVEYGIRVPGMEREVYLPVDAKFPTEDYERLLGAVEVGDVAAVEAASVALERTIKRFAKEVSGKYINPPHTADWAILFLPTEGLYAEVLRRPGLFETLQRDMRVTVAGPANFQVLLSTFRMGFRQIALQERANEVWDVLGAVKLEFGRFGEQIDRMGKSLNSALNHVETLDRRKRVMLKALKNVEEIEADKAEPLLLEE